MFVKVGRANYQIGAISTLCGHSIEVRGPKQMNKLNKQLPIEIVFIKHTLVKLTFVKLNTHCKPKKEWNVTLLTRCALMFPHKYADKRKNKRQQHMFGFVEQTPSLPPPTYVQCFGNKLRGPTIKTSCSYYVHSISYAGKHVAKSYAHRYLCMLLVSNLITQLCACVRVCDCFVVVFLLGARFVCRFV